MSDIADEDEDAVPVPPRKTSRLAWLVVVIIVLFILVPFAEMLTMRSSTPGATFSRVGSRVK